MGGVGGRRGGEGGGGGGGKGGREGGRDFKSRAEAAALEGGVSDKCPAGLAEKWGEELELGFGREGRQG